MKQETKRPQIPKAFVVVVNPSRSGSARPTNPRRIDWPPSHTLPHWLHWRRVREPLEACSRDCCVRVRFTSIGRHAPYARSNSSQCPALGHTTSPRCSPLRLRTHLIPARTSSFARLDMKDTRATQWRYKMLRAASGNRKRNERLIHTSVVSV